MKRVSIDSLESAIDLMRRVPALQTLPALQPLRPLLQQGGVQTGQKGCCGQRPDFSSYRVSFERAFRSLTEEQKQTMKRMLGVDEVSFFSRANGQITPQSF